MVVCLFGLEVGVRVDTQERPTRTGRESRVEQVPRSSTPLRPFRPCLGFSRNPRRVCGKEFCQTRVLGSSCVALLTPTPPLRLWDRP